MSESPELPQDWSVVSTEQLLVDKKGAIKIGPFGSQLKKEYFVEEGYKVYGQENVFEDDFAFGDRYIDNSRFMQLHSCKLCPGDIVISMMGTVGKCTVVPESIEVGIMDSHLLRLQVNENKFDKELLLQLISGSESVKAQIKRLSVGGIMEGLSSAIIKRIEFPNPPLAEQRKIAKVLSSIDNLIEKTQALIDKYQSIKQGMMHDLFTRGVDENGQLRPSYEDAPHLYKESGLGWIPKEWKVERLQDALDFLDGQRIPLKKEDRSSRQGDIPYYGASGIIDYVDDYIFDGEFILLGEDGENVISRNLPLAFKVSGKIWVNNHAHILKPKEGSDIDFYTEYLESKDYSSIISGSAQPKITQGYLSKILVVKPSYQEQKDIAKRLSSLHVKVKCDAGYLRKMKVLKKGLMQDLLTGKVRVKVDS